MRKRSTIKMVTHLTFLMSGMLIGINCAVANPVEIVGVFNWRDIRSPNTVNYFVGDRLVFGADVVPVEGTIVEACQGAFCTNLPPGGDTVYPYEFSRSIPYEPALTGKWVITATNESDAAVDKTNAVGNVGPLPFVRNTRIAGTGLTPTIKWDLPVGNTEPFTHLRIGIFDDVTNERIYLSPYLPPSTRKFTVPGGLLSATGRYVFRVILANRLDGQTNNLSTIFINFRPLPGGSPAEVYFPVVENGVFHFDFDVEKGVPVFIDPESVLGYQFAMGVEDTVKFASVTLPEVGDNLFDLYLFNGSAYYLAKKNLASGQKYNFIPEGVDRFRILEIEKSAGLDPNDVAAFITELTFTDTGQFTGSMAPIVTSMPTMLESSFNAGDEGWWIFGDGTNFTWHASGGNPGGFISAEDQRLGESWFFVSPNTWAGDWTFYIGGTISYDLKLISGDTSNYSGIIDVIIDTEGTGHYAKWSSGIDLELGTWTHYEVRISESNFEIVGDRTWDEILSNVTYLFIRGEHIRGPDTEGIDNIRVFNSPSIAEIIGTWSNGIRYWDVDAAKWTKMTSGVPSGDITAGDFTGDGIADVASCWDSGLWYQDGATLDWTKVSGSAPGSVTAGDVTGDGRSEIIGTWSSGIWYWDVVAAEWTKMTASTPTGEIAAGDFTGDGRADVASCWGNGLWYQDGATLDWTKVSGPGAVYLTAGDVTGDGRSEIIGTWSSGIWYWDVAEAEWTKMTASTPTEDIAAGDFTGDGKADVASCWGNGLWYQDGYTLEWTKVSNRAPTQVTAGDITGD